MSSPIEQIEFTQVAGGSSDRKLRLYSLSTCAFCKRAMDYLSGLDIEYSYVHLDQIDFEKKREVKAQLKRQYENIPVFPILTIDDSEAISGFVEEKWAAKLGLE